MSALGLELVQVDCAGYSSLPLTQAQRERCERLARELRLPPLEVLRLAINPGLTSLEGLGANTDTPAPDVAPTN